MKNEDTSHQVQDVQLRSQNGARNAESERSLRLQEEQGSRGSLGSTEVSGSRDREWDLRKMRDLRDLHDLRACGLVKLEILRAAPAETPQYCLSARYMIDIQKKKKDTLKMRRYLQVIKKKKKISIHYKELQQINKAKEKQIKEIKKVFI